MNEAEQEYQQDQDIDNPLTYFDSPLFAAIRAGSVDEVRKCIIQQHWPIELLDQKIYFAFAFALIHGDKAITELMYQFTLEDRFFEQYSMLDVALSCIIESEYISHDNTQPLAQAYLDQIISLMKEQQQFDAQAQYQLCMKAISCGNFELFRHVLDQIEDIEQLCAGRKHILHFALHCYAHATWGQRPYESFPYDADRRAKQPGLLEDQQVYLKMFSLLCQREDVDVNRTYIKANHSDPLFHGQDQYYVHGDFELEPEDDDSRNPWLCGLIDTAEYRESSDGQKHQHFTEWYGICALDFAIKNILPEPIEILINSQRLEVSEWDENEVSPIAKLMFDDQYHNMKPELERELKLKIFRLLVNVGINPNQPTMTMERRDLQLPIEHLADLANEISGRCRELDEILMWVYEFVENTDVVFPYIDKVINAFDTTLQSQYPDSRQGIASEIVNANHFKCAIKSLRQQNPQQALLYVSKISMADDFIQRTYLTSLIEPGVHLSVKPLLPQIAGLYYAMLLRGKFNQFVSDWKEFADFTEYLYTQYYSDESYLVCVGLYQYMLLKSFENEGPEDFLAELRAYNPMPQLVSCLEKLAGLKDMPMASDENYHFIHKQFSSTLKALIKKQESLLRWLPNLAWDPTMLCELVLATQVAYQEAIAVDDNPMLMKKAFVEYLCALDGVVAYCHLPKDLRLQLDVAHEHAQVWSDLVEQIETLMLEPKLASESASQVSTAQLVGQERAKMASGSSQTEVDESSLHSEDIKLPIQRTDKY